MAAVKSEDSMQVRNPAFQFLTDFRGSLRLEAVGTQGSIGLAKSGKNSVENPLKKKAAKFSRSKSNASGLRSGVGPWFLGYKI